MSLICSIRSTFEFRTLDPEGLVLYGDTHAGAEWFMLGLRGGVPEMQIRKNGTIAAVTGGPRLNNGHWHQVRDPLCPLTAVGLLPRGYIYRFYKAREF